MRIVCRVCNADIFLNEALITQKPHRSKCPFCNSQYQAKLVEGSSDVSVEFGDASFARVCAECGKNLENQSSASEFCDSCEPSSSQYSHKTATGLEDDIIDVGNYVPVKNAQPGFSTIAAEKDDALKLGVEPAHVSEKSSPILQDDGRKTKSFIVAIRNAPWLTYISVFVLCGIGAWFGYRLVTHQVEVDSHPAIRKYLNSIDQEDFSAYTELSFSDAQNQILSAIKADKIQDFPKLIPIIKRNLVAPEIYDRYRSVKYLLYLCHVYARLAEFGLDETTKASLVELGTILENAGESVADLSTCKARMNAIDGKWESGRTLAKKEVERSQKSSWSQLALASILEKDYNNLDSLKEAISIAHEVINKDPTDLEAYMILGKTLDMLGSPDKALDALEQRLQLSPEDALVMYTMANIYFKARAYTVSRQWLEDALRRAPEFAPARVLLAQIQMYVESNFGPAQKNLELAIQSYAHFLSHDQLWEAKAYLADLYLKSQRHAEAQRLARTFTPAGKPAVIIRKKADILADRENAKEAVRDLESVVIKNPLDILSNMALAKAYLKINEPEKAAKAYAQSFAVESTQMLPGLYSTLAEYNLLPKGRLFETAQKMISERGLNIGNSEFISFLDIPSNSSLLSLATQIDKIANTQKGAGVTFYILAGLTHLYVGMQTNWTDELKKSIEWITRANRMINTLDYPWLYLGIAQYQMRQLSQARTNLEQCLAVNPVQAACQYWLSVVDIADELTKRPKDMLTQLKSLPKWNHRADYQLGVLEQQLGHPQDAIEYWRNTLEHNTQDRQAYRSIILLRRSS